MSKNLFYASMFVLELISFPKWRDLTKMLCSFESSSGSVQPIGQRPWDLVQHVKPSMSSDSSLAIFQFSFDCANTKFLVDPLSTVTCPYLYVHYSIYLECHSTHLTRQTFLILQSLHLYHFYNVLSDVPRWKEFKPSKYGVWPAASTPSRSLVRNSHPWAPPRKSEGGVSNLFTSHLGDSDICSSSRMTVILFLYLRDISITKSIADISSLCLHNCFLHFLKVWTIFYLPKIPGTYWIE